MQLSLEQILGEVEDKPGDVTEDGCTIQYSTVQYSTVQYSTVQYSAVPGDVAEDVHHQNGGQGHRRVGGASERRIS